MVAADANLCKIYSYPSRLIHAVSQETPCPAAATFAYNKPDTKMKQADGLLSMDADEMYDPVT